MSIILIGPPGSGKGTQSKYIAQQHSFFHLSTGDLLRAEIQAATKLGNEIKQIIDSGALVNDQTMIKLIKKVIEQNDSKRILFDGFPRTVDQAKALSDLLRSSVYPVVVIHLIINKELLLKRIEGRYTCDQCGAIYNIQERPLERDGFCQACGGKNMSQRNDDNIAAFEKRFSLYEGEAKKILAYYQDEKICIVDVDASQSIQAVRHEIDRQIIN